MRMLVFGVMSIIVSSSCAVFAETTNATCNVEIQSPAPGSKVSETADVSGVATIPVGAKLWVFVHRKGLALWWPQGSGPAQIDSGKWQVLAYFGMPRDIGSAFEITGRVVDAEANSELEKWVSDSEKTGRYPGISMKQWVAGCLANTVTVNKTN